MPIEKKKSNWRWRNTGKGKRKSPGPTDVKQKELSNSDLSAEVTPKHVDGHRQTLGSLVDQVRNSHEAHKHQTGSFPGWMDCKVSTTHRVYSPSRIHETRRPCRATSAMIAQGQLNESPVPRCHVAPKAFKNEILGPNWTANKLFETYIEKERILQFVLQQFYSRRQPSMVGLSC